ncbi:uncharacterized protein LOC111462493 isoform X1 [Cucurbita moschata]|uniref:Uncharacterized protein LOC111462493 isoform X1 n=1 Tax=Cucurbita moschata TaxID=3662 RepID=A0A6J1HDD7_CUCMO|nr:uncharacterized protein LOC111462493 isoform X1 [Cucurbita moschata]
MSMLDSPTCFVDAAASHNTVFIDTSLGTHLAMAVSDGDIVSDIKGKIEKEHPLCFPHLGTVKIHAIKVTRKGHFYHLSDSMYLKSAFVGYNDCWFLSVDASIVDGQSTDPNTGNLSTYFERAGDSSVDRINVARNNHGGHLPNHDASQLQDIVTQEYVNEKAPSRKDLTTEKEEVTHSVENCSKHQSGRIRNGYEGLSETLESLPTVKVNRKSKKRKTKLITEHEVVNHTGDDNDQNSLQQVVGSGEKSREYVHNKVFDHPMMERKSNVGEPGQVSSSSARDESEHGRTLKFNLSEEAEVDDKNYKSKYLMDNTSLVGAAQAGFIAKKMPMIEMTSGVMNGVEGNRVFVSESSKATSTPKVTSEYLSDMKQTAKVVVGSLSTEPDDQLPKSGSSYEKKKTRKRKSKLSCCPNEAVGLISSRVEDQQDASRESDITTVPSQDIEEASIPNLLGASRKRHNDSNDKIAETSAPSLVGESCDDKNNIELGDVQSIRNASDKAVLGVKGMIDSKDIASKSKDPTDLQKSISTSEDANNVRGNHLTCKTGKVPILEGKEFLQVTDTKASMVENCHSSSWDGTDANVKAADISESVHLKGTTESAKHGKKRKIKKSRGSAEERQINLVTAGAGDTAQDILPIEPQSSTLGDNSCSKAEIGENNVSLMKGENTTSTSLIPDVTENAKHGKKRKIKKSRGSAEERQINLVTAGAGDTAQDIPPTEPQSSTLGDNSCSKAENGENNVSLMKRENTTSTSLIPDARNIDIDKPIISKVGPSMQINQTQAVAKDMDGQVRKKNKKRPVASMKSTPDLQEESIGNEDSFPSKRIDEEVKPVSIAAKKTKFPKANLRNEIEEANLDSTLFSEVETTPSICKKSKTVGPSLTPSLVSEGYEERPIEANRCSNTSKDGTTDNVDNHGEVPYKSDKVGIEEKAVKLQHKSVEVHVDKLSREKSPDTLLKSKRKKKSLSACSSAVSLSTQDKQKSDENTETEEHWQTSNSSALKLHVDNKLKKNSRGGVNSLPSNEHKQQTSDSNKAARVREKVVDSSRGSTEIYSETPALPKARPKLKNSANMAQQDQKHRGSQSTVIGHPLGEQKPSRSGKQDDTQSQRKNSLLTSGGIFKDASSDSSEDEGGIADSDARSPDNSLISNFSDGESNGSVDLERTNTRRSMRKKEPSSPENMTLDIILRSSSRYKKAKLTAVQSLQDDTESQPVDFVPDSQPNI